MYGKGRLNTSSRIVALRCDSMAAMRAAVAPDAQSIASIMPWIPAIGSRPFRRLKAFSERRERRRAKVGRAAMARVLPRAAESSC